MSNSRHDPECIFCRIANGEAPAAVIVETDDVIAILDAFPAVEGHTLVMPKSHHPGLQDIPAELLQACAAASQQVALAVERTLGPDGIALAQYNGSAAGQTVFHYHQHIMPRWHGRRPEAHGSTPADMDELQALAERIRAQLDW